MTSSQHKILQLLLDGHHIAFAGAGRIRLRDSAARPILNVPRATFDWLQKWLLLRKKGRVLVVNRKTIRSLHGNSAIKRLYKGKPLRGKPKNTPPPVFDPGPDRWDRLFFKIEKSIKWPN